MTRQPPKAAQVATMPRPGASSDAMARAKAHFASQAAISFKVPQWADDQGRPLVVTARPLNLMDKDHLAAVGRDVGAESFELMAHIVILHARDEQGRPLFTMADKPDLMARVDPDVLTDIAARIVNGPTVGEIKKKS